MLWIPERKSLPELLDLPHDSYARDELEGALKDLTLVNRYLGNGRAVLKHLAARNAETADEGFTVLDVATGTGDIPIAIAKWARQAGIYHRRHTAELDRLHSDFPPDQALQQEPHDAKRRAAFRAEVFHPRRTCRARLEERDFRFQGVQRTFLAHRPRWKGTPGKPHQRPKRNRWASRFVRRMKSSRRISAAMTLKVMPFPP
jgi:hypothetical protein